MTFGFEPDGQSAERRALDPSAVNSQEDACPVITPGGLPKMMCRFRADAPDVMATEYSPVTRMTVGLRQVGMRITLARVDS